MMANQGNLKIEQVLRARLKPLVVEQLRDELRESVKKELRDQWFEQVYEQVRKEAEDSYADYIRTKDIPTKERIETEAREEIKREIRDSLVPDLKNRYLEEFKEEGKRAAIDELKSEFRESIQRDVEAELNQFETERKIAIEKKLVKEIGAELYRDLPDEVRSELRQKLLDEVRSELKDEIYADMVDVVKCQDDLKQQAKVEAKSKLIEEEVSAIMDPVFDLACEDFAIEFFEKIWIELATRDVEIEQYLKDDIWSSLENSFLSIIHAEFGKSITCLEEGKYCARREYVCGRTGRIIEKGEMHRVSGGVRIKLEN